MNPAVHSSKVELSTNISYSYFNIGDFQQIIGKKSYFTPNMGYELPDSLRRLNQCHLVKGLDNTHAPSLLENGGTNVIDTCVNLLADHAIDRYIT